MQAVTELLTGVIWQQISVTLDKILDVVRRYEDNKHTVGIIPKLNLRTTRK
jgi:hypothetical protein